MSIEIDIKKGEQKMELIGEFEPNEQSEYWWELWQEDDKSLRCELFRGMDHRPVLSFRRATMSGIERTLQLILDGGDEQ